MLKREHNKGKYYYRSILVLLVFFLSIILIPFVIITYHQAETNILSGINQSNNMVLRQMKYSYRYSKESMAKVCLSTYFRTDVQQMLYNETLNFNSDIYMTIKKLKENVMQGQPSLDSVEVYNACRRQWYSTETGGISDGSGLSSFISSQQSIPKLVPILRKTNLSGHTENVYQYVFTYFMYDYADPKSLTGSYLAVNQNAYWFVDNITNAAQENTHTNVYLTDSQGEIYNYKGLEKIEEDDQALIRSCLNRKRTAEDDKDQMGFVIDSYQGEKSLVSYMNLEDRGNHLIMVQSYDEVFADLLRLRNDYLFVTALFSLAAIILTVLMSRRLYRPVNKLVDYVSQLDGDVARAGREMVGDEFQHLQEAFRYASEANVKLREQKESSIGIVRRYLLDSLLQNSCESNFQLYAKNAPQAPLVLAEKYDLTVMLIHIDHYKNNQFGFLQEDLAILRYSVENVVCELLIHSYMVEITENDDQNLVLVLNRKIPEESNPLEEIVEQLQKFTLSRLGITVSVAVSCSVNEISQLSGLYDESLVYSKYRMVYGPGAFLQADNCRDNIQNSAVMYSKEQMKKLNEAMKLGSDEKIDETLDNICYEISKLNYNNIMISIMTLLNSINATINEINLARNSPVTINFGEMYQKVVDCEFIGALFKDLSAYIKYVLSESYQVKENESVRDQTFVRAVMEYVSEYYADMNLSAQSIADHMGMSSRYVLKKFKQCAGNPLNEYILTLRMKKAADLLINTEMPINQIASNIGIENDSYFYHLFKKIYGCTPREFSGGNKEEK